MPVTERRVVYGRLTYELTDDLKLLVDGSYGWSRGIGSTPNPFDFGNDTISIDNPFLPDSIRTAMIANNITSFGFGRLWTDFGNGIGDGVNETKRVVGQLRGSIGDSWNWDAGLQVGQTDYNQKIRNAFILARKNGALDAVRAADGSIVCRSTLTNPSNGCVPFNPFGIGQSSAASYDYLRATQQFREKFKQLVASVGISGTPFDVFGNPLSIATGAEYRRESVRATADALGQVDAFAYGNYKPLRGSLNVKEAYFEAELPLLENAPLAKSLSFNGAVRYTDYNISGSVVTWKVGGTWDLTDGVRLRATRSRDIRAPNLSELFSPPRTLSPTNITDPTQNNSSAFATIKAAGNINLKPEKADTFTAGAVLQPRFIPGLSLSVDYYDIKVKDAIGTIGPQDIVDRCSRGDLGLCNLIVRSGGVITQINTDFLNIAQLKIRGLDFEASYSFDIGRTHLGLRLLANHVIHNQQINGGILIPYEGQNGSVVGNGGAAAGVPDWTATAMLNITHGPVSAMLSERFVNSGKYRTTWVEGVDINDNSIPAAFYTDISTTFDVAETLNGGKFQLFGIVNNLFNKYPPVAPGQLQISNPALYDMVGRSFRIGARVNF